MRCLRILPERYAVIVAVFQRHEESGVGSTWLTVPCMSMSSSLAIHSPGRRYGG